MTQKIRYVVKETLKKLKGFGPKGRESWWQNEHFQNKRVKNECLKIELGVRK